MNRASGPLGYRLAKTLLRRPLHAAYDVEVEGIANVPNSGPVIVAANHRSFMDSVFLALVVDRPVSFLAKAEYFDRRRTAVLFRAAGQIPVRRGSPSGARKALDAASEVLAEGGIVGIYPEGTRSRDGLLHRGNLGPARLALATGAPILPVGLIGTEAVQEPDKRLPRVGKSVTVRFGPVLQPEAQTVDRRAEAREMTERLMSDIADLCGQRYVRRTTDLVPA